MRYGTIKGQLEAMIEAFGRPAEDRHSAFAYTPVMQVRLQ